MIDLEKAYDQVPRDIMLCPSIFIAFKNEYHSLSPDLLQ